MNLTLRPYQLKCIADLRNAYRNGSRAPLLVAPTGSGKTVIFTYITEQATARGNSTLILVHRQELIDQTSQALSDMGVVHGIIAPKYPQTPDLVQIASVQTLVRRLNRLRIEPDLIIIDECFPADTMIDGKPIQDINIGDIINVFCHEKYKIKQSKVIKIFKNKVKSLLRINLSNNKTIICTPNHPIYSLTHNNGCYINAKLLSCHDMVLTNTKQRGHGHGEDKKNEMQSMRDKIRINNSQNDMFKRMRIKSKTTFKIAPSNNAVRNLWNRCYLRRQKRTLIRKKMPCLLFKRMFSKIHINEEQYCNVKYKQEIQETIFRKNEEKQSHEKSRCKGKSFNDIKSEGVEASSQGRKWSRDTAAAKASCLRPRMGYGSSYKNSPKKRFRLSVLLQSRYSKSRIKNCNRSRWELSLFNREKEAGRKENGIIGVARVESIEILKSGSDGAFGGLCPDGFVYNIEVEKYKNYFANGVLVHNCQHSIAKSWDKIISYYPNARKLGVTATPLRLDGKGLSEHFDTLVLGPEVQTLIDDGYLSEPIIYSFPFMKSLQGIHKRAGDFNIEELADVMNDVDITGDAVHHYLKYTPDDPAITFCTTIKHASDVTDAFNKAGVKSQLFAGKMTRLERRTYIQDLAIGKIKNLVSCQMVSEGTDIPIVRTAILLRPTQSLALCLQQCGRVLRPYPGKPNSIILDHAGNCVKHGPPQWSREWSLDGVKHKPSVKAAWKQCPRCFNMIPISATSCPCGYIYVAQDREIEYSDTELERLDIEQLKMIKQREKKKRRSQVFAARTHDELVILGHKLGYADGWAYHIMQARERKQG